MVKNGNFGLLAVKKIGEASIFAVDGIGL
jgi:hypothetical protein